VKVGEELLQGDGKTGAQRVQMATQKQAASLL